MLLDGSDFFDVTLACSDGKTGSTEAIALKTSDSSFSLAFYVGGRDTINPIFYFSETEIPIKESFLQVMAPVSH